MGVSFSFELLGAGWADCAVRIENTSARISASFLSDALGDLASATAAAMRGHPGPTASFLEEPGEYRWILDPGSEGQVRVRILKFPAWKGLPADRGEVLLDEQCRLRSFAGAIVSELQRLKEKHGDAGYRNLWIQHDFPEARLAELRDLLAEKPSDS